MRFMLFIKIDPATYERAPEPSLEDVQAMQAYNEQLTKAGVLLALDGLQGPSQGARVELRGGEKVVTDGPFAEAVEVVGGYWILQTRTKEEAVEWARRCPLGEGDALELRQVFEVAELSDELQAAAKLSDEPPLQTVDA
ncbi:YciI family protein [Conexibacter sp. SYSU D00693]|uniref:YciI family protein n=1 Tax=Conexibacter sp. SYSU D00693 TaxID=2812560 RepID=UPI00196A841E|nr:YciI family protein [Conexibacter sp. SYSU D00693]